MTTTRVTVPVDERPAFQVINDLFAKHGLDAPPWRLRDQLVDHLLSHRSYYSAAPAPEGGAVSIWSDARNVFVRYAELFAMTERYEEASAIADKAAHEIEALATREEAPAEAGELASQIAILRKAANSPTPDEDAGLTPESALKSAQAWRAIASNVVAAFDRAQPQAREDAQPCNMCGGKGRIEYEGGEGEGYPSRPEIEACPSCAHPAPDALRVAVEALEPFAAFGRFEAAVAAQAPDIIPAPDDSVFKHWVDAFDMKGPKLVYGDLRRAASALAALQAEQEGGA